MKDLKILRRFAADIESGASFPVSYFQRFHDAAPGAVVELIDLVHDLSRRLTIEQEKTKKLLALRDAYAFYMKEVEPSPEAYIKLEAADEACEGIA